MKRKPVFIAERGEDGEGSSIIGVFGEKEDAVKAALAEEPCFSGGWRPNNAGDRWKNGCDFVQVTEFEVE